MALNKKSKKTPSKEINIYEIRDQVHGTSASVGQNMNLDKSVCLEDAVILDEIMQILCIEGLQGIKEPPLTFLMQVYN